MRAICDVIPRAAERDLNAMIGEFNFPRVEVDCGLTRNRRLRTLVIMKSTMGSYFNVDISFAGSIKFVIN
jgi:hypothetical protein